MSRVLSITRILPICLAAFCLLLLWNPVTYAQQEIHVPLDYENLQDAINAVADGGTVYLDQGVYQGPIVFPANKSLNLTSTDPLDPEIMAATIINADCTPRNPGFAIILETAQPFTAAISGLTISRGHETSPSNGGGVACVGNGNIEINHCVIKQNSGSAVYCEGSDLTLFHCFIDQNHAANGGGIQCAAGNISITQSVLCDNTATDNGGAIYNSGASLTLTKCTLSQNSAQGIGGGVYDSTGNLIATDCIFWQNRDANGSDHTAQIAGSVPNVTYSCIQDAAPNDASIPFGATECHNIDSDPCFTRPEDVDGRANIFGSLGDGLRLLSESPCVGTGRDNQDMGAYPAIDAHQVNVSTNEETPLEFTVVSEQQYSRPLRCYVMRRPNCGEFTTEGRVITYTPQENFFGIDTMELSLFDGIAYSHNITVNIEVLPLPDPPHAENTRAGTLEDRPVRIELYAQSLDRPYCDCHPPTRDYSLPPHIYSPQPMVYSIVSPPTHGTVEISENLAIYTPDPDFSGEDSFTYIANDGTDSNIATVSLRVMPQPEIWHVNNAVSGGADNGRSWADAFDTLQEALAVAAPEDCIWVAAGNAPYVPGSLPTDTFHLAQGVTVYGGFAGDETFFQQRDWAANTTILSGQLPNDNCYHVVTGNDDATLDGLMITQGNADGAGHNADGGGLFHDTGYLSLENCAFLANDAVNGAAIANQGNPSTVSLSNCVILNNSDAPAIHNQSSFYAINSIIYDYEDGSSIAIVNSGTNPSSSFSYSNVSGSRGSGNSWNTDYGRDGRNNIDRTPVFVDADGADNILATADDNLSLTHDSPGKSDGIAYRDMGLQFPRYAAITRQANLTDPVSIARDSQGNLFVLCSSTAQIHIYNDQLSLQKSFPIDATNPMGLALDGENNIYIADTGNNRILKYTLQDSEYVLDTSFDNDGIIGTPGSDNGQFNQPWSLAIDDDGDIYVSDSGNNRIQGFRPDGQYFTQWGRIGSIMERFSNPADLRLIPDRYAASTIFLADYGNRRVAPTNSNGFVGYIWSMDESSDFPFVGPRGVDFDSQTNQLIVADTDGNCIQIFYISPPAELVPPIMGYVGQIDNLNLSAPADVLWAGNSSEQIIYIADTGNNRLIEVVNSLAETAASPLSTWEQMKAALRIGDIDTAVSFFTEHSQQQYAEFFQAMADAGELQNIVEGMRDMLMIEIRPDWARYELVRQIAPAHSSLFPVDFILDETGRWRIERF